MMNLGKRFLPVALAAGLLLPAHSKIYAATATWIGNQYWTNAANWDIGVPAPGDDMVITDSSASFYSVLTDDRTIGRITFGNNGNRTAAFYISNITAAITLTMTNGLIANGNAGSLPTTELFRLPVVIANDQTFTIGGGAGSSTGDAGIRFRERANGVQNALTLTGALIKDGPGQLSLVGRNVGDGNIVVNQGSLKLNGGGSTTLTIGGTGAITVNSNAALFFSRNSGAFQVTKAIVMNGGSTLRIGGGGTSDTIGSPITFNDTVTLSGDYTANSAPTITMGGAWSGPGIVNINNITTSATPNWLLRESAAGLTGRINNAGNGIKIRFGTNCFGSASAEWALNNANASYQTFGATNVQLGALSGGSGTLQNQNASALPATFVVGALGTTNTFNGTIIDGVAPVSLVKVGTGWLNLGGNSTFTGGTIVSNGTLYVNGASANLGGGPVEVRSGATLGGNGNINGAVTVANSGRLHADGGAQPLTILNTLTLGTGGGSTTNRLNVALGGKITTGGVTVNGTSVIEIVGAGLPVGVYDLIVHNGSLGGAGFAAFQLGRLPYGISANLQNGATAIQLNITANTLETRVWVGDVASQWNLGPALEWKGAVSGLRQNFHDEDTVLFDNSATSFNVNVTEFVQPSVVTFDNTTTYTLSGTGLVDGNAAMVKNGTGTVILGNTNIFNQGITLNAGVLQIGDGATAGAVSGPMTNNASVVLNRADAASFTSGITGTGSVTKQGAGRFVLGGANSYAGTVSVEVGTLAAGSGTALGDTNVGTTISAGATLDVNQQNLGMEPVSVTGAGVEGAGAIVNNGGGDQQQALRYVTLTGPTTIGGFRRLDIRDPAVSAATAGINASFLTAGHKVTKVGTNAFGLINVGETGMGDLDIQAGTVIFSRSTIAGNAANTITIGPGAALQLHRLDEYQENPLNKRLSMTDAALAIESNGLTNTVSGQITLTGSNVFNIPTTTTGLKTANTLSGNSSLTVNGPGAYYLNGNATYTGPTTVNAAVMVVNGTVGTSDQPFTAAAGSTLAGNGTINGPVTVAGALTPGEGDIGSLRMNNSLVLAGSSTTRIEYSKDMGTNDNVRGLSSVTMAGTLVLTNTGFSTLIPGDNLKLFYATTYSGMFSAISPATPGAGLVWYTNDLPTMGVISVRVLPNPEPIFVHSASSLVSNQVNVIFNIEVDEWTAIDAANYTVSTGQPVTMAQKLNTTNVLLTLGAPITTPTFSVQVKNVRNTSYVPITVTTTNVPGKAWGFASDAMVAITNGLAFAYGTNQIKIHADGSDIFGVADQFHYVWREVTGDFDVSANLNYLLDTDPAAKAGIMARDIQDATYIVNSEREVMIASFPGQGVGRNNTIFQFRPELGGASIAPGAPRPPATFPNTWLRLKRVGPIIYGMSSSNNVHWLPLNLLDTSTNAAGPLPPTLRLGLAVTSHNVAATTESIWSAYGAPIEGLSLNIAASTNAVNAIDLSWAPWYVGTYKLKSTSSLTPPITWTDVPGSATTNFLTLPIGADPAFFKISQ